MSRHDGAPEQIVARLVVFVISDDSEQLRSALPNFQDELRHWPLTHPHVRWDAAMERLILEVDVTADDRAIFGLDGYAELVADQAY